MLQQEICFVHIRISIAGGHVIPEISYKSRLVEKDLTGECTQNFPGETSFHATPASIKVDPPPRIELENLDENDLRETLLKLKGLRYDRDLTIETYTNLNCATASEISFVANPSMNSRNNHSTSTQSSGGRNERVSNDVASDHAITTSLPSPTYAACVGNSLKKKDPSKQKLKPDFGQAKAVNIESDSIVANKTSGQVFTSKMQLTTVPFFSGNPAVDITNGIIHLYKTNFKVPVGEGVPPPQTNTLCMLAVPASIDIHNLLEFTAAFMEVIHRMRIIRDHTPNQYMVILTFVTEQYASEFYLNLNNQSYSSLIPEEVCRLAFVASIEALAPPSGKNVEQKDERFLPLPNSTELPDCMVCLERMDESVQGLLTVLCNHSFHAACLQQWEDLCCPVCRYVQTPEAHSDNKCMVCGAAEDLWICLVCGNVGCGRYTSEHAQRHYIETHHNYAMSLSDNRVWDYAGDYFVHRLFQNKDDGKLVEKNTTSEQQETKYQEMQIECMHFLHAQLESQREYWEGKVFDAERKAAADREEMLQQLEREKEGMKEIQIKVSYLEKEKQTLVNRSDKAVSKLRDALKELVNEREMNKSLTQNQDVWKAKVNALEERCSKQEAELNDLKEQLRDMMFYIEASQKISNEDKEVREELREGQVVVGPSVSSDTAKARAKAKRRTR